MLFGNFMKFSLLILLSLLIISSNAFGKGIKVIAEEWPPFSFQNNESITGFAIEIIEELIKDAGLEQDGSIEIWPWARALIEIQKRSNILITAMNRSKDRENLFKWVGPISPRQIWLYKLASRDDISLRSLEDAKSYQIGVVKGSSSASYLIKNDFIESTALQTITFEVQNIKKLLLGRVDLIAFSLSEVAWQLKRQTPPVSISMVEPTLLISDDTQYYIALSKQVPDSIIIQLQNAFDQLKKDGRYKKIWQKYME